MFSRGRLLAILNQRKYWYKCTLERIFLIHPLIQKQFLDSRPRNLLKDPSLWATYVKLPRRRAARKSIYPRIIPPSLKSQIPCLLLAVEFIPPPVSTRPTGKKTASVLNSASLLPTPGGQSKG